MKCCLDCPKRNPGCHSTCQDYITESAEERERKEKIRKAKAKEKQGRDYVYEHYYSQRRRHGTD